jgi:UDP-glucose 4-epimerase
LPGEVRSLVTGGAGFIGSHLADALVRAGDRVTVVDDLSRGRPERLAGAIEAGAQLVIADVRDSAVVSDVFASARPQRVFHLAAQTSVRASVDDPAGDATVNVLGTINVLEAARVHGTARVVSTSTGGPLFAHDAPLPLTEDLPPAPASPYGQSKLAGEGYCELYRRLHGLSTLVLRYANVYGPRQDPAGEAGVVAIFCGKLLQGEPVTLFGDGHQSRDFVYVDDVVAATLAAERSQLTGPVNVGTGLQTSLWDLIESLAALTGRPPEVMRAPARLGERRATSIDSSRARERLGWEPAVALHDGLARTLQAIGD